MEEIIRLERVVKLVGGGIRAINDISLRIDHKERVKISGPAGSGKTTLLRLIAGMDTPSAGGIYVMGQAVHSLDMDAAAGFRSRTFGVLNRNPGLWGRLAVRDNVALPLTLRGVDSQTRERAAMELLEELGIAHLAHAHPQQLSVFESQMASLARAFIAKPPILLIDEMTADCTQKESGRIAAFLDRAISSGAYTALEFTSAISGLLNATRAFALDHGTIREETT